MSAPTIPRRRANGNFSVLAKRGKLRLRGAGDTFIEVINIPYKRIRNLREDNDLSQQQVASYLHISQRTYSYYENGEHNMPLSILVGLADFYNTSTDYLLERTNDPAPRRKR